MNRRRQNNKYETLVKHDTRAKELIATIEALAADTPDAYVYRERLESLQTDIRENIAVIISILEEIQQHKKIFDPDSKPEVGCNLLRYDSGQLFALQTGFRKALFKATQQLQALEREQLSQLPNDTTWKTVSGLGDEADVSMELTRDMTACARRMADEVKLGAINAQLLEDSSAQIGSNLSELKDMSGRVQQSGRLASLATQRRVTSYVLYTLAFSFFFLSCLTIFLNRIPMGSWFLPSSYL